MGRNAAVSNLGGEVDLLMFPNDDTVYSDAFWAAFSSIDFSNVDAGLFALRHSKFEDSPSRRGLRTWNGSKIGLTRSVLTAAHEPGMIVRYQAFRTVSGFDERIGVGSPTFIQSGEGSDLLARLLLKGCRVRDLSGELWASESDQERGDLLVAKRLRYAAGPGYVLGRHRWLPCSTLVLLRVIFGASLRCGTKGGRAVVRGYWAGRSASHNCA